jgi:hypothetical protein
MIRRRDIALLMAAVAASSRARAQTPIDFTDRLNIDLGFWPPKTITIGGPIHPPECATPDECGFVQGSTSVTTAYCPPPVYGRNGQVKSPITSCNTTTTSWTCTTCGKKWDEKS